ncbi:FG-GAP-like repeat-containing protein [Sandaracinus amylolyticus]|uniref:FG-GAP-like repeat-containing protein n=1 Tax=Sandaracinus amylolyticus TaxID=927083 RepID=UPI001F17900D|nr:FG-GAP-like repeat-containing protein [Sandaracinus amylolyticus]UJR86354.1 Hypothetical protein I5071_84480 [Sandaracinus amylolyticus]
MKHAIHAALLVATLASCTQARTQIMLRVRTDMAQGPSATLAAIRIRVSNDGAVTPAHDQRYALGTDVMLPSTLGVVPDAQRDALLSIEIDALGPGDTLLFTHRAQARYVEERTLLLDVFLAARCREAVARDCDDGQTCGPNGCEPVLRSDLPEFDPDAPVPDAGVIGDGGGTDACTAMCSGACVDTTTDPAHCGDCGMGCDPPASHGEASCFESTCTYACEAGYHVCGDDCVSNRSLSTCGDSCEPCAAPSGGNGVASCDGARCGFRCDPGYQRTSDGCVPGPNVEPPRPISPLSLSRVTSLRPTFRWALASGSDGALVQVCEDRACARIIAAEEVGSGATSLQLGADLALPASGSRRVYFRLFGRSGPATGSSPSVVWSFELPARSAEHETAFGTLYDVNADGHSDLAVGSEGDSVVLYTGSDSGLTRVTGALTQTGGSQFGAAVAAAGDVDGDGYADLVLGAPAFRRAYLYRGSTGGLGNTPLSFVGAAAATEFGRTVAPAGDVNGDGYADVLVGAPSAAMVALYVGAATPDSSADVMLAGPAGSRFGASLSSLGDLDGDGRHEFAIGAPGEGRVYLFRGAATLPASLAQSDAFAFLEGPAGADFGAAIAGALDVSGDGRPDLLVSSPSAGAGESGIRLFLGNTEGGLENEASSEWSAPGAPSSTTQFGASLHANGDVNRDGYDDWVVGAPGVVRAYVFRGGPSPSATAPAEYSSSAGSRFGADVTSTGDVDGDGHDDTLVGAPTNRAFHLYLHTAAGLATSGTSYTDAATTGFGAALAALLWGSIEEAS